jgi:hypothetical protein
MKSVKILNYICSQFQVNIAVITTKYSNQPFLLCILSCLYFLDCVYKHLWQNMLQWGSCPCETWAHFVSEHIVLPICHVNQELNFIYKKKQTASEWLYRDHLEYAPQLLGMWLCIQTYINMKFCYVNDILYDKWYKKLENLHNLNIRQKKTNIQTNEFYTCVEKWQKIINRK